MTLKFLMGRHFSIEVQISQAILGGFLDVIFYDGAVVKQVDSPTRSTTFKDRRVSLSEEEQFSADTKFKH